MMSYPPPPRGAEMVQVEDDVLDPGEIVVGLKAQLGPAGAERLSEIWLLKPPTALALIIRLAEPLGPTVTLETRLVWEQPPC